MSQLLGLHPFRKRHYRTLSLLCDDEPLSDAQLKAYHSRLQEYQTFLDAVSRLALCGNVCITEELVTIGEHGLLTGESLNALQHAGAISVYNTLQQNNWEFPVAEEGEVAVIKAHNPVPDEFLDSEKPIRSDWPAVHISECFVEGERAKLHGSVRPLRTFLPPTVVFRNAADVDEDIPEPELNIPNELGVDGNVELVPSAKGITVKRIKKDGKEVEFIPIDEYFFGRQEGTKDYYEEKGDFRFKCAVCQRIFYSNIKLMSHILGHVDESSQAGLNVADSTQCQLCEIEFASAFDLRAHMEQEHPGVYLEPHSVPTTNAVTEQFVPQTASQLLMQQRDAGASSGGELSESISMRPGEHGTPVSTLGCRICGKDANSELALAHHLQSTHREREMPYVCRLCLFRSSLFEDILEHFKKEHDNSNHLLCTYCLRIFTPSDARAGPYTGMVTASGVVSVPVLGGGIGQTQVYLQHLRMHQIQHQLRRCPTCKLNFTNKSDYQVHRRLDHRATRGTALDKTEAGVVTVEEVTDQAVQRLKETQPHITLMNAPEAGQLKSIAMLKIPENIGELACLECNQPLGTVDHKQYLPCSMCRFGTCCSMGYNRHMSRVHVYISGTHQTEPDTGMPLVRPVYFQWMADEVKVMEEFERQLLEQEAQQRSGSQVVEAEELQDLLQSTGSEPELNRQQEPASVTDTFELPVAAAPEAESRDVVTEIPEDTQVSPKTTEPEVPPEEEQHKVNPPLESMEVVESDSTRNDQVPCITHVVDSDDADIADLLASGEELTAAEELATESATEAMATEAVGEELAPEAAENEMATEVAEKELATEVTEKELATEEAEENLATESATEALTTEAAAEELATESATEAVTSDAAAEELATASATGAPATDELVPKLTIEDRLTEATSQDRAAESIAEELVTASDVDENFAVSEASSTDVLPLVVPEALTPEPVAEEPSPAEASDMKHLHVVMKYMASQLDARRFACTHCAASNLNGNSLARHLVEECGSTTVTLNPNPALIKARMEAEEQYRLQQEMQQHEQNEAGILFEATDTTLSGAETLCMPGQVTMTEAQTQGGDVIMVAMEPDQLASYGVMEATGTDQTMTTNELVTQIGSTGTTIDVTNADGEVVQQFIIPDDLQLEEGQTLVVIHGEDGQPQLAIVNQADLIDPNGSRMVLQSEEDEANMLLYTNTMGQPTQPMDGVVVHREEEKENHQFAI